MKQIIKNKKGMAGIPLSKMGPFGYLFVFGFGILALIIFCITMYMLYMQLFG